MKMSTTHWLVAGALISASTAGFAQGKPACGLNNGKPATGAPIPIGAIVGKTGPDDFSASSQAAAAYFKCVNANGGINGRPVDYIVQDDQWNPEVAAQAASRLVKDRKVVAMVGNSSFVECGANAKFYAQEDIMAVAGVGVPRECFFAKNYAPVNTGPRISGGIVSQYAVQKHKLKSLVCIPTNIPGLGAWACEGVSDWGKANGVQVKTLPIDPGSADATSVMLQAAAMKPDGIVINLPKGLLVAMLAAAEQQGLHKRIKFMSSTPAYNADVPKAIGPAWYNNLDIHLEFNPIESAGPDNKNWKAVMDAYASPKDPRDSFAQAGYLAARIATETLLKMDPAKIDRASVTQALRKVTNFQSDMLCKPYYIGDGARHNPNHSGPIATVLKDGFKQVSDGCLTAQDPELKDVLADQAKLGLK